MGQKNHMTKQLAGKIRLRGRTPISRAGHSPHSPAVILCLP